MGQPTGKTYIPSAMIKVKESCTFVTKHGGVIIAAATVLDPTLTTPVTAAIASIQSACAVFEHLEELYDPYYGHEVARPEP